MGRRRRSKGKGTLIHEQAAHGSGTRLGVENPIAPVSPQRVKPREVNARLETEETGGYSRLTRMHLEQTKAGTKREVRGLARRLKGKPYSTWTAEEMAEAQRLLGPEVVSGIYSYQQRKRRRRQGSPN